MLKKAWCDLLDALQEKLLTAELFDTFCEEYVAELNRLRGEAKADIIAAERELASRDREMKALIEALKRGVPPEDVTEHSREE